jgi:hypothetical protein
MSAQDMKFSRISKLFADRDQTDVEVALARRQEYAVTLLCGDDVGRSYTLQLAVLTAANIANRCFPGAVRIGLEPRLREAPLLLWPSLGLTFGQALIDFVGSDALDDLNAHAQAAHTVIFGDAPPPKGALRVTFDGWIAKVGPVSTVARLQEREFCSLAGVLAAALAISELFLSFADISIEACRRTVGLSLWRPDLNIDDPAALGIPVEFLPRELWVLGLGHLGNAYLWSIGTLPYRDPREVELVLNDLDKVECENVETGLLLGNNDVRHYKTRACGGWLERRGFQTRLVERWFDSAFRCRVDEPRLALCGFDSNPARRDLATAQFLRVVESGLGGTTNNFDTISVHTLPNPRPADELWPDLTKAEETKRTRDQERVARENAAYLRLSKDECGRFDLAGKSIAVPFVGAAAASLVVAESIRLLHDGPAYTDMRLALGAPGRRTASTLRHYTVSDLEGLKYCHPMKTHD